MNKLASRIPWKSGKCDFNVKRLTRPRIFHGRVSNDRTLDGPQLLLPFCYVTLGYVAFVRGSLMLLGASIMNCEAGRTVSSGNCESCRYL